MTVESENLLKSEIPHTCQGMRADKALALLFPQYSRNTLQKWLKQGLVVIDDEVPAQRDQVQGGELVEPFFASDFKFQCSFVAQRLNYKM